MREKVGGQAWDRSHMVQSEDLVVQKQHRLRTLQGWINAVKRFFTAFSTSGDKVRLDESLPGLIWQALL